MKRVSFDFDHTLSTLEAQCLAYSLIQLGVEVWVCTARCASEDKMYDNWGNEDLFSVTDSLDIPRNRIIFCNYEEKRPFLEAEGFIWHLDDDNMVVRSLNRSFVKGIHCLQKGWLDKCINLLNLYEMNNLSFADRMRIVNDTHADYDHIKSEVVGGEFNIVEVELVVKEKSTGKFLKTNFFQDVNIDDQKDFTEVNIPEAPIFREVFPYEVTTIIYK